ncbi:Holliday junction resolvase RuvX [Nocardia mexicana]|uniref:Putative pre-16S rRNA nuclease n=1 Tax=Nocardia mexicana TaxID=279262 RepID=A0A370H434_9NOCA|nr:Holliday junction resolvase RuvX [Nocardia mexicana]RDI50674.1 putative Holliday junction resolvase [Nocardia mexicana]
MDSSESPRSPEPTSPGDATARHRSADTAADRPDAETDPGRGRRIAIDVGTVRIGVAACDPDGILATPVETVQRATAKARRGTGGKGLPATDLARIAEIVREYEAVEVIVGLPRTLRGENGTSAQLAISFAEHLRSLIPGVPIRLSDERLTTVTAARALRDSGVRARGQRQMIDQAAAVSILQGWLDERSAVLKSAGEQAAGWSDE